MKPADDALAAVLAEVEIRPPRVPVWSNVDARPHSDPEEIRGLLVRQVLQPVLWEQTTRGLLAAGGDRFYEIGPGTVLSGLLKACNGRWTVVRWPRDAPGSPNSRAVRPTYPVQTAPLHCFLTRPPELPWAAVSC